MSPLEIVVAPAAKREIKKLDKQTQQRVIAAIRDLESNQRPRGVEKLQANPAFLRLRVGNYRIIYNIFQEKFVLILTVKNRKEAYRSISDIECRLKTFAQHIDLPVAANQRR